MDIPVSKSLQSQLSRCKQVTRPQLSAPSDQNVNMHILSIQRHGVCHGVPARDAGPWSPAKGRHLCPIWSLLEWQTPQVLLRKGMS